MVSGIHIIILIFLQNKHFILTGSTSSPDSLSIEQKLDWNQKSITLKKRRKKAICLTNRARDTFYLFTPTSCDNAPVELQSDPLCRCICNKIIFCVKTLRDLNTKSTYTRLINRKFVSLHYCSGGKYSYSWFEIGVITL